MGKTTSTHAFLFSSFFYSSRKENLIIDYPLQQDKLVPCIATTYAFFTSFIKLENLRKEIIESENILFELLPEVMQNDREFFSLN